MDSSVKIKLASAARQKLRGQNPDAYDSIIGSGLDLSTLPPGIINDVRRACLRDIARLDLFAGSLGPIPLLPDRADR